jgi:predicted small secreted protein
MKIVLGLILAAVLAGCSTVAGVGKDIQDSADWTKEKIGGSRVKL